MAHTDDKHQAHTINVRVVTSSGHYPKHGHEKVPVEEPIQAILNRAANQLEIVDSSSWVATINGAVVQATMTYQQLKLHGEVVIDWGRHEGGGG